MSKTKIKTLDDYQMTEPCTTADLTPVKKRVMPTVIANGLHGVSPMCAPNFATCKMCKSIAFSFYKGPGDTSLRKGHPPVAKVKFRKYWKCTNCGEIRPQ